MTDRVEALEAAQYREFIVGITKFCRAMTIRSASLVGANLLLAVLNAWNCARMLDQHHYGVMAFTAAAALGSVCGIRWCLPTLIQSFRLWQVHCLLLESIVTPPPDKTPPPPA